MNLLVLIFVDDTPVSGTPSVLTRYVWSSCVTILFVCLPAAGSSHRTSVSPGSVSAEIHGGQHQEAVCE